MDTDQIQAALESAAYVDRGSHIDSTRRATASARDGRLLAKRLMGFLADLDEDMTVGELREAIETIALASQERDNG